MKKTILCLTLLILFGLTVNSFAREKVAWFNSGSTSKFWPIVEKIMVAAAKDLGLDLKIYEYKNDPFYMVTLVQKVLADPKSRPDCILFHNFKKKGEEILKLGEKFDVPVFLFNAGFAAGSNVGNPREKYPHWIGQMLPDDEYAGYLLTKELISTAKHMRQNLSAPIQMVALEGNRTSDASNKRVIGLKRALTEHPKVINNQFFHSKWKSDLAKEAFQTTLQRYPHTTVFWAASETMAIAIIEAAKKRGLLPGKDFITGGFDLLPENEKYIASGDMAVSVGGHYFEGAWALILVFDYLNGIDFKKEEGVLFTTKMSAQTREDLTQFNNIFTALSASSLNNLDFRHLSKFYNPRLKRYNFDLDTFLQNTKN